MNAIVEHIVRFFVAQAGEYYPAYIVAGLVLCFWGYKVYRFLFAVPIILCGAAAGWAAGAYFSGTPMEQFHFQQALPYLIIGGILGGILSIPIRKFAVFFLGGMFALSIAASGFFAVHAEMNPNLFYLIVFLAGGIVAVFLEKPAIILSSAAYGALLTVTGLAAFAGRQFHIAPGPIVQTIGWLAMFAVGLKVQFGMKGGGGKKGKSAEEKD